MVAEHILDAVDDLTEEHFQYVTAFLRQPDQRYDANTIGIIAALLMIAERMPVGLETCVDNMGLELALLVQHLKSTQLPTPATADASAV